MLIYLYTYIDIAYTYTVYTYREILAKKPWKTSLILGKLPGRCYVSFNECRVPKKKTVEIKWEPSPSSLMFGEGYESFF